MNDDSLLLLKQEVAAMFDQACPLFETMKILIICEYHSQIAKGEPPKKAVNNALGLASLIERQLEYSSPYIELLCQGIDELIVNPTVEHYQFARDEYLRFLSDGTTSRDAFFFIFCQLTDGRTLGNTVLNILLRDWPIRKPRKAIMQEVKEGILCTSK